MNKTALIKQKEAAIRDMVKAMKQADFRFIATHKSFTYNMGVAWQDFMRACEGLNDSL